jgi:hypothetical protein
MLTLNPSHEADLALALRVLGVARRRVDQEERLYGKARVAKVHLRALRDAMAQVSYLGVLGSVERT